MTTYAPWLKGLIPPVLLILAGVLTYWNSFDGVFLYDDLPSVRDNPHIRTLWPLSEAMSLPLWSSATTVDGRPLLSLSFALNHWIFGPSPWGYHLVNMLIHIAAGLLLFGIVRRTLALPRFRERYARSGSWLALATALIWLVHPLQTESVTYIVQRAESLMGMCFLLTMYCAIRGFTREGGGRIHALAREATGSIGRQPVDSQGRRWYAAAVLACAAGMGVKQTMFSAPLLVLLYDGLFVSDSFRAALKRRWRLYAGLFATWLIVVGIIAATWQESTVDFAKISPVRYLLTQPLVLLHYLRLAIWPSPLVLDHAWPLEDQWPRIVFPALAIVGMLMVMLRGICRRKGYGFVLAWFFLILAPTSSIAPMRQAIFEHRMYLPLAAVVLGVVMGADVAMRRLNQRPRWRTILGVCLATAMVAAFGFCTHERNKDYHSAIGIWQDNIVYRPESQVARNNLGSLLLTRGDYAEASTHLRQALRIQPDHAVANYNLGNALLALGHTEEAITHYQEAVRIWPDYAHAHNNLGNALMVSGRTREALEPCRRALRINPDLAQAHFNLGNALFTLGQPLQALSHYQQVVQLKPDHAEGHNNLGVVCRAGGRHAEAIRHFEQALRLKPDYSVARENLRDSRAMMRAGRERPKHPSTQIPKSE